MILLRLILLHKMRHHQKPRPVYDRRKALGINTGIDGHGLLSSLDRKCSNLAHYLSYIQNCICTGMTLLCEYIIITRCAQFNNVINNLAKLCMCIHTGVVLLYLGELFLYIDTQCSHSTENFHRTSN